MARQGRPFLCLRRRHAHGTRCRPGARSNLRRTRQDGRDGRQGFCGWPPGATPVSDGRLLMNAHAQAPGVHTTCPYCGVGCGVVATPDGAGGGAIAGDKSHPANFGRLCSKGAVLGETLGLETRLLHPMVDGARATWDAALDRIAGGLRRTIERHGPGAVAFYVSGQLLTEDYYVANKLMKGFIGAANVDTNSRLCMASSVAGHKRAFGSYTVPGCYQDLDAADLVVLVGSNAAWCHPVLYQRMARAGGARRPRGDH